MATLLHVGTSEVLASRAFEHLPPPSWAVEKNENNGSMEVRPWDDDHLMVFFSVGVTRDEFAVNVTVAALYRTEEGDHLQSEDERREFFAVEVENLFPFLRQAVHNASSQVWPVEPVMLDIDTASIQGSSRPM